MTVTVPHATVGPVALDLERSKAVSRQRGIVNRFTSAFSPAPAVTAAPTDGRVAP